MLVVKAGGAVFIDSRVEASKDDSNPWEFKYEKGMFFKNITPLGHEHNWVRAIEDEIPSLLMLAVKLEIPL